MTKKLDPYRLGSKSIPSSKTSNDVLRRKELRRKQEQILAKRIRSKFGVDPFEPSSENGLVCPLCHEDCIPNAYRLRIIGFSAKWKEILQFVNKVVNPISQVQNVNKGCCPLCFSNKHLIIEEDKKHLIHSFVMYENSILGIAAGMNYIQILQEAMQREGFNPNLSTSELQSFSGFPLDDQKDFDEETADEDVFGPYHSEEDLDDY